MEQRTLLAVTLSILVLIVYNIFVPRPPLQKNISLNISQPIAAESDTIIKPGFTNTDFTPETVPVQAKSLNFTEETQHIGNKYITINTSNINGSIKSIVINRFNYKLPVTNMLGKINSENKQFTVKSNSNNSITYVYSSDDYEVLKTYRISGDNLVKVEISITNSSDLSKVEDLSFANFTLSTGELDDKTAPMVDRSLFEYSVYSADNMLRKSNATNFSSKNNLTGTGKVYWTGFRDRFFCAIFKPDFNTSGFRIETIDTKNIAVETRVGAITLNPGQSANFAFTAYFGPQDLKLLKNIGMDFAKIVSFSNISVVDFLSKSIVQIMGFIYKIIPNWGICIVFMSILVYFSMYPLTLKGMLSMRKMQALQPRMTQLREQFKNNPQKLNKEIMELYKTNGVNPLGGCFPFLLQMPVFIGLYQALWRTVQLKGSGFLWIKDLAGPDKFIVFPSPLPLIGNDLNILPIIMAIIMFFQQRLSTKNIVLTDEAQLTQQKMMAIFLPIMLGVIFYKFSSGLTLYFTLFYLFSTFTQWKMSKVTVK